jgi:hypothetical protein
VLPSNKAAERVLHDDNVIKRKLPYFKHFKRAMDFS